MAPLSSKGRSVVAKGEKRGNREIKKPKQEEVAPKAADPFTNQTRLVADASINRAIGKARSS
jgi:hypothetical protein